MVFLSQHLNNVLLNSASGTRETQTNHGGPVVQPPVALGDGYRSANRSCVRVACGYSDQLFLWFGAARHILSNQRAYYLSLRVWEVGL